MIKILCREFGFYFYSQKGSHVKLKNNLGKRIVMTIVPIHQDLAKGTIKGILRLGEINEEEFWNRI